MDEKKAPSLSTRCVRQKGCVFSSASVPACGLNMTDSRTWQGVMGISHPFTPERMRTFLVVTCPRDLARGLVQRGLAMARKTVDIDLLVQACNNALALDDATITRMGTYGADDAKSYRHGVIAVCEQALSMANAYKGFRYLESELGADGTLKVGYDETRREYAVPYVRVRVTE